MPLDAAVVGKPEEGTMDFGAPYLADAFLRAIAAGPIFCFTSDMDWADDDMISFMYSIFDEYEIALTPFITNHSAYLQKRFGDNPSQMGVHPNFLPGSSHGATPREVCDHVIALNPAAKFYRSHRYSEGSEIACLFRERGFEFDSNLDLIPQPGLRPLLHSSGLVRYPVFLGDGTWFERHPHIDFAAVLGLLPTPGLKIFSFHPVHVCLNTPDPDHYRWFRQSRRHWRDCVHPGVGTRSNLKRLLEELRRQPSAECCSLPNLHRIATADGPRDRPRNAPSTSADATAGSVSGVSRRDYDRMNTERRAEYKRAAFQALASGGIYATSRDHYLRELEIDFIVDAIDRLADRIDRKLKVADLGCGNGYTTLRIASALEAEIIGIDFADALIAEAGQLVESFSDRLRCTPRFEVGDITQMRFPNEAFDVVVTERVLLNMTDQETQAGMMRKIHGLLRPGGIYVLVEGNRDGLGRLNALREELGLEAIPDREDYQNAGSLKFNEGEFEAMIEGLFTTRASRNFGTYFLISRVIHPLYVSPDAPTFDHKLNEIARAVQSRRPDLFDGGHLMGRVLEKIPVPADG
jgi:ubiquinone/menaquinone biosynthesis C-methylase UbiE